MRVSDDALRKLIKGTFLATPLLAAQEGGKPLNEATWIFVGAVLVAVVDAYAIHMSGRTRAVCRRISAACTPGS